MLRNYKTLLFVSFFCVVLLSFAVFLVTAPQKADRISLKETESELHKQALLSARAVLQTGLSADRTRLQNIATGISRDILARVTVIDVWGKVLADSDTPLSQLMLLDDHSGRSEIMDAARSGYGASKRYSATLKKELIYSAVPLKEGGTILGYLRVARPVSYAEELKKELFGLVLVSMAFALGFAVLLSIVLSRYLSHPIERLKEISLLLLKNEKPKTIISKSHFELGQVERSIEQISSNLFNATEKLRIERAKLSAVLFSMKESVIAFDRDLKVILMNRSSEKLFGLTEEDGKGRTLMEALRSRELADLAQEAVNGGATLEKDLSLTGREALTLQASISPIRSGGTIEGAVIVISDLTRLKKLEGYRRDFIANISHELKTPLSVIISSADTLLAGAINDPSDSRQFLSKIERHARNLALLINDILELSRLESGRTDPELVKVDLCSAANSCVSELREKAVARGVELVLMPCRSSAEVMGDEKHIRRALANLIDNAVNYTDRGGRVEVKVSKDGISSKVEVRDTGIGIPKDRLDRIFERFYRVDADRSRDTGGTGLGLAIVKHVMDLHKGRVLVESSPGQGSVFTLVFPRA
ncbi:MAG: ATP-binding protein [Candidatus Margulisiibacteriota bacterium]